ncbi:MAG: hypothetical protein ACRED0_08615 [Gammaproteobacteria bacterium]
MPPSSVMTQVCRTIEKLAPTDTTALLWGESGTDAALISPFSIEVEMLLLERTGNPYASPSSGNRKHDGGRNRSVLRQAL